MTRLSETLRNHSSDIWLGLLVLVIAGLWVHPVRAQQASRYALTAAIVDDQTVVLDDYEHVLGIDRAVRDGHVYSDKAPGQPFLAVPFYAAYRVVGGEPATTLRIEGNLGVWWVTFWTASVPLAVLTVVMRREAQRFVAPKWAILASLTMSLGTLLLPFGALLFGHVLSALLLYAGYVLLGREDGKPVVAGLLLAGAVTVEYTAAIGVLVVVLSRWRSLDWRSLLKVGAGAMPPAIFLAAYQWIAFGSPFVTSYSYSAFTEVTDVARPVASTFATFSAANIADVFFAPRGFAVAAPSVLLALVGCLLGLRQVKTRGASLAALVVFAGFLLIPAFWANPWGGDSPGPRYMTPALPFLAVPLGVAFSRVRLPGVVLGIVGATTMLAALATDPLLARNSPNGFNQWYQWVRDGQLTDTVLTMGFGQSGWVFHTIILLSVLIGWMCAARPGDGRFSCMTSETISGTRSSEKA